MRPRPLILGYHALGDVPREHDPGNLVVHPDRFRAQIRSLRRRGYELVTVAEFADRMRAHGRPPKGVCALSFDDGTLDGLELLPGILREEGAAATIYVCPGLLGVSNPFMPADAGVRLMEADEIRAASSLDCIEIGSHTTTHVELVDADEAFALAEMTASKAALEEMIGTAVETFAYPNCTYSSACPGAARRAGYTAAVTCGLRGSWEPYELQRELIDGLDRELTFALKSRGAWKRLFDSPPGRLARRAARRRRHPASVETSA